MSFGKAIGDPVKLRSIQLRNYRCFEDLQIEFDSNLMVFVGGERMWKDGIAHGHLHWIGPPAESITF